MPIKSIKFTNLGKLKNGHMLLNDLTIFTGPNNSGKTYITYVIYGLYKNIHRLRFRKVEDIIPQLLSEGFVKLDLESYIEENLKSFESDINEYIKHNLYKVFNYEDSQLFKQAKFDVKLDLNQILNYIDEAKFSESKFSATTTIGNEKKVVEISYDASNKSVKIVVFNKDLPSDIFSNVISLFISKLLFNIYENEVFILPAERAGLNLFYKELNTNRNALIESIVKYEKKKKLNPFDIITSMTSRYPQPIADYIFFLNDIDNNRNKKSEFKSISQEMNKKILDGTYKLKEDEIYFMPYRSNKLELNLHVSSSAVKSLFGLNYYLEHMAKSGDILVIDEPELNLHPNNHRKLARIICNIVNRGIKVILSTHSDHFIKEINNLIMLSNKFNRKSELIKKYKYNQEETIDMDRVSAYIVGNSTIKYIPIKKTEGITESTFDSVINDFNISNDDIYYSIQEESYE